MNRLRDLFKRSQKPSAPSPISPTLEALLKTAEPINHVLLEKVYPDEFKPFSTRRFSASVPNTFEGVAKGQIRIDYWNECLNRLHKYHRQEVVYRANIAELQSKIKKSPEDVEKLQKLRTKLLELQEVTQRLYERFKAFQP